MLTLPTLSTLHQIPLRDGAKLAVRTVGRGTPVVLLHGFGMHSGFWLPNVLPLSTRYRFIMPDLRGFGHSHRVRFNSPDILVNYAEDLEDLLNHYQLDQVILGGISMGALTSLKFNQLGHFNRVSKYLNIDQAPQVRNLDGWQHGLFGPDQPQMFERFRSLMTGLQTVGMDTPYWQLPQPLRQQMMSNFGEFFAYVLSKPLQQQLARRLFRHGERAIMGNVLPVDHWQTYLQIFNAYLNIDSDTRPALPNIQIPMTLMIGQRSRIYPAAGQMAMQDLVPHARVVAFPHAGHAPMLDQPILFQRELGKFLAR